MYHVSPPRGCNAITWLCIGIIYTHGNLSLSLSPCARACMYNVLCYIIHVCYLRYPPHLHATRRATDFMLCNSSFLTDAICLYVRTGKHTCCPGVALLGRHWEPLPCCLRHWARHQATHIDQVAPQQLHIARQEYNGDSRHVDNHATHL